MKELVCYTPFSFGRFVLSGSRPPLVQLGDTQMIKRYPTNCLAHDTLRMIRPHTNDGETLSSCINIPLVLMRDNLHLKPSALLRFYVHHS